MKPIKILIVTIGLIFAGSAMATTCSVEVNLSGAVYGVPAESLSGTSYANGSYDMLITAWIPAPVNKNMPIAYIPNTLAAFKTPLLPSCYPAANCTTAIVSDTLHPNLAGNKGKLLQLTLSNVACTAKRIVFNTRFVSTDGKPLRNSSTSFGSLPNAPQLQMDSSQWMYTSKILPTMSSSYTVPGALGRATCGFNPNITPYCRTEGTESKPQGYCYWYSSDFPGGAKTPGIKKSTADATCNG